ncbi:Defensin-like protein 4 [Striga hermonthica]|uniref:Defensin-like protein 4 n=1 Tax=Striga hermonthica TaxID=68872 RepID=A0A9N7MSL2_STRHE|nr:Defensin-like protein 4 [Striga hermonthica]
MSSKAVFTFLLLIVLLFTTHEEMRGGNTIVKVAGRTCDSQSHGFKGQCWSDTNCGLVCRNEGFPSGHCRGFRKRCFCRRPC